MVMPTIIMLVLSKEEEKGTSKEKEKEGNKAKETSKEKAKEKDVKARATTVETGDTEHWNVGGKAKADG